MMESRNVAPAANLHFWRPDQPCVLQTLWPWAPLPLSYEVAVPRASFLANDYAGVVVPSQPIPWFYNPAAGDPKPKERRKFFLNRSLFDLADAHPCLALTDPKLLSWYLCLSPEDRRIIEDEGGFHQFLHRHPALELSNNHVYVKYNGAAQSAMTPNKHTSITPQPSVCSAGMSHPDEELRMLANNVTESLPMLNCTNRGNGSQKQPHDEICHTKQLVHLQDSFQTAHSSLIPQEPKKGHEMGMDKGSLLSQLKKERQVGSSSSSMFVCKDPATLASVSLDMELERCRQRVKSEHRSPGLMTQERKANFTCAEISPLQSEWSTTESKSPEYYSFGSIQMDDAEYNDTSSVQSAELNLLNCLLDPVEENCTKQQGQAYMVCNDEDTIDKDDTKANLGSEDQNENFCSIMEEDKSILVCVASSGHKAYSGPITTDGEALAGSSEIVESDQSVFKTCTESKSRSHVPCVSTCDVGFSTERELCVSAFTQTDDPKTANKHIITEVHMADLDYLAVEFLKLKTAQEKLKEKEKIKSSGYKLRNKCDCIHRAQQAELSLLTLQYSMCRQHCWSLYYTTAGVGQANPVSGDRNQYWPKDPPANILTVLHKLESDYNELRDKILEGVPLERLKPLSVDCEKITTAASYTPAQIIANVSGSVLPRRPQEPQRHGTSGGKNGCTGSESKNDCQANQVTKDNRKAKRAVTLVPQGRGAFHDAKKLVENQTTACKELSTSEAWYDAEEDLEPAELEAAAEAGQNPKVIAKDRTHDVANEGAERSVLCLPNLTHNVTESDVMLSFKKCHGSEVSISALNKDSSGLQPPEAAARESSGSSMQDHTSRVEPRDRAVGGSQGQTPTSISGSESSQDATKPQAQKTDYSSSEKKLTAQPPLCSSIKNRQVVCVLPMAKGTCVPQHYGTMGSFDTLMAELTLRHPDVGRQEIVGALEELRAKHQGVLSGLPLRTIREMVSELLTRPDSASQF